MHRLIRLIALLAILLMALPVAAQDGLSSEEEALMDRLIASLDQVEAYTSYIETRTETNSTTQVLVAAGQTREGTQSVVTESVTQRASRDPHNLTADITVTFDNSDSGEAINNFSYVLSAEVRVVDNQVYVNATREGPEDIGLPEVPAGWVLFEDEAAYPGLADLELDDLLEEIAGTDTPNLFEQPELLKDAATAATLEDATLDDGSPAERIILTIDGDGIGLVLGSTPVGMDTTNEATALLMDNIDPSSAVTMDVVLGEDDVLFQRSATLDLIWVGLDVSQLSPDIPEGLATVDLSMSFSTDSAFTDINSSVTPAEVPEIG